MGTDRSNPLFKFFLLLVLSSCAWPVIAGACGYGAMAVDFNGGYVAAGSSALHIGGLDCEACFQIRCNNSKLCSAQGVKVILTDLNKSNTTDFLLTSSAFMAMAQNGMAPELNKLGILDIEYKKLKEIFPLNSTLLRDDQIGCSITCLLPQSYAGFLVSTRSRIFRSELNKAVNGPTTWSSRSFTREVRLI